MSEPIAVISSIEQTSDADTYLITFAGTGHTAQLQVDTLDNVLHADHDKQVIVRYSDYDDDLTDAENDRLDHICKTVSVETLGVYIRMMSSKAFDSKPSP